MTTRYFAPRLETIGIDAVMTSNVHNTRTTGRTGEMFGFVLIAFGVLNGVRPGKPT